MIQQAYQSSCNLQTTKKGTYIRIYTYGLPHTKQNKSCVRKKIKRKPFIPRADKYQMPWKRV